MPKKDCIRLSDTNNSTQSLTRVYDHTATKSLYRLRGAEISLTPILAEGPYQFGLICFSICLQCKISGSSVFSIFFHEGSHHKVRKVMEPNFLKKVQMGVASKA